LGVNKSAMNATGKRDDRRALFTAYIVQKFVGTAAVGTRVEKI